MFKWIRWPGLIAFVALFGGLFVFFYFFATVMLKNAIEDYGSEAVGAEVNVDSVKLTLDPLGFHIGRIQVTNPDAPETNAVEVKSTAFDVGFWNLFMGQFIINELSVDQMQFNTQRAKPGFLVEKKKETEKKNKEPSMMDQAKQNLPSAKEILDKETLLVDVKSDELQQLYDLKMKELDELKSGLVNSKQMDAWEKEIKELTSGKLKSLDDFKQRKERLSEINKEIKAEKEKISKTKEAYSSAYKDLNAKLKELKDAPSQDWKNLKGKYSLDAAGATNITRMFFGDQAAGWTTTALEWYEKAKPYLESEEEKAQEQKVPRKKGRYIHFGGIEKLPEFLLREARIDVLLPAGHLNAKLTDVTHQPDVLGRPARLKVSGTELNGYDSILMNAEFNHVDPKNSFDKAVFEINKMDIKNFNVSKDSSFKLKLAKAKTDITGVAVVRKGRLDLDVDADFRKVEFKSEASSGTAKQVGELLQTINQFTITVKADGKLNDLSTSFDSSLDEQLKAALNAKIDQKQAELEAELKQKLQAKLQDKAGKYSGEIEALLKGEKSLSQAQDQLEKMGKAKLTTWEEQQKEELEAKKKAEKQKAKKEAEQQAKDKLKNLF